MRLDTHVEYIDKFYKFLNVMHCRVSCKNITFIMNNYSIHTHFNHVIKTSKIYKEKD